MAGKHRASQAQNDKLERQIQGNKINKQNQMSMFTEMDSEIIKQGDFGWKDENK
jgi:hypothetical protein